MNKYYSFPSEGFLCWKAADQKTPTFFSGSIEKKTELKFKAVISDGIFVKKFDNTFLFLCIH